MNHLSAIEIKEKKLRLIISALLILIVFAIYGKTIGYDFVSVDDFEYVRDNPNVNTGWSVENFKWAFTHPVAGNWHPVTMLSHMTDCQLYGLARPGLHHLTSWLLHAVNAILLLHLLLALTRGKNFKFWGCVLVAGLFAAHPLRVESVAWISERKDVLSGFFFLLTIWFYVRSVQRSSKTSYALSILFFAFGLMSKPMIVTLPCVLLLLDYWPLGRLRVKAVLEKIPYFALSVVFSIITFQMQKSAGAVVGLDEFPLKARLANAVVSYLKYIEKTFWPSSLTVLYPQTTLQISQVIFAAVVIVGLTLTAVILFRRKPFLFVGWFIFAGMLVPVSGLFQAGEQAMADRYSYLPSIGFFIAIVWLVRSEKILAVLGGPILAALLLTSSSQVRHWKNSRTLFEHAVAVTPENSTAHHYLGVIDLDAGNTNSALDHFLASIRFNPMNVKSHGALGYVYSSQGKFQDAVSEYETGLKIEPANPKLHVGLAETLAKIGRPDLAVNHYIEALRVDPTIAEAHFQLGSAMLSGKQDPAQAIQYLRNAMQLAPDWVPPLNSLAWTLATFHDDKFRDGKEAVTLAKRAVELTSENEPGLLDTLAAAYAETGQFDQAIASEELALKKAEAQPKAAAEFSAHLKLFQSHQPIRE